jgi:hypothetical protein
MRVLFSSNIQRAQKNSQSCLKNLLKLGYVSYLIKEIVFICVEKPFERTENNLSNHAKFIELLKV